MSFGGSDATSGLAGCSGGGTLAGPDGVVKASGSCADAAGNSGSAEAAINYDSTPPTVTEVRTDREADFGGWFNNAVNITFVGQDGGSGIDTLHDDELLRAPTSPTPASPGLAATRPV